MRDWLTALAATVPLLAASPRHAPADERIALKEGWSLTSSAQVAAKGEEISRAGFSTSGWQAVTVPNTVVGALVENGTYKDPYFGMNLRSLPGMDYPIGTRFTLVPTPDTSPFKPAWWYRRELVLPASLAGRHVALHFGGISYRANIWFNGTLVDTKDKVVGVFRQYEYDVTALARPGQPNVVAVEVVGPEPHDLAFMWVDWNPTPPDKNMGLWGDVYLTHSGPLALRNPHVVTKLPLPALDSARVTVTAEVVNRTDREVAGIVRGAIEDAQFSRRVTLKPREKALVRFSPDEVKALTLQQPRLWWPYRMGEPNLYTLALDVETGGVVSDRRDVRFGVQQWTDEMTPQGHRLYKVNGKPVLVRGGGWASDMMLRPPSTERLEAEMRYVREMGLNTIRLEGKLETDEFYDLADRHGIMVMPGWCCCDQWEKWDKWDDEDHRVGPASLRDQILRIRNHPSVFVWLNGSDFPPPARVEQAYLDVLKELEWSKPILSNATAAPGPVSGPSGVKMAGPYDYVPPMYWLTDKKNGGAFGFATEIGPGAAVPPLESLQKMLPAESLWPIDAVWRFHAGGDEFKDLNLFTAALEARYGKATSAEDYARKAQALTYEGQRAMFEGYGRNKYTSTGVIQWMLNNAWPSMIWHLYDWYLRPAGGYYGSKKALEKLHVQFSHDDRSVAVVNEHLTPFSGLKVTASLFNLDLKPVWSSEAKLDVAGDGVARSFVVPKPQGLSTTYFLRLALEDARGKTVSRNFYWLSTREDVLDPKKAKWFYTPTKVHADLTALATLPATTLKAAAAQQGDSARVTVENTGQALAFLVHLRMVDARSGEEALPVFWEDNYFELMPGEKRELTVSWPVGAASGPLALDAAAWNVARFRP
ncbi:MAG TPA: glycoside hydrolase family 2 protein [Vicinamibacteria bacterium]|nr:glycoside hydrolase family 2 protein [Vicinamibacteria bacterium]